MIKVFLLLPFALIVKGFIILKLWSWIIAPTFSVEKLSLAESVGLSVFSMLFMTVKDSKDSKSTEDNLIYILVYAGVMLLIGWITSQFI